MKLSIVIPYYNTYEYTRDLLVMLKSQLTPEIEILIIDDGCNEKELDRFKKKNIRIYHLKKNSGGASKPRNNGIEKAKGEYITFIDSDDMIADDYIAKIMKAIEQKPDIIFLSWQSKAQRVIMNLNPPKWNCAVWCRVYKREIIGNTRFDEELRVAEDWKFNQQIKYETKVCIKSIVYYYNNGRKGSILNG